MAIKRKREHDASWSELGFDPLECILRKLPFLDLLRFKRVCCSWFSVVENYVSSPCYSTPCFQTPWLLLPSEHHDDEGDGRLCFFNLDEKKEYRDVCFCREVYDGRCVGSSHVWLILLDKTANLSVFNPFSGARISVGSLKEDLEFTDADEYMVEEEPRLFVPKAVMIMSDHNKKNKDKYGVVLIYGNRKKQLAFCRYRDGRFIELDGSHHHYHDIICYANYMVSAVSEIGSVEVWDFSGSSPTKVTDMLPSFPLKTAEFGASFGYFYVWGFRDFYLVESCGELLLIERLIRKFKGITQPWICPYKTLEFHVYMLDRHEKKWVKMESLGDRVVFVGGNQSISLRVEDCRGCIKDSIYFTDSYWEREDEDNYLFGGHDMGYYNLRDKSVKPFYENPLWKMNPIPFWIVPSPL